MSNGPIVGERRLPFEATSYRLDAGPVLYIVGFLLILFAIAMLVPMTADLVTGNSDWIAFAMSALFTLFIGGALAITCYQPRIVLTLRQTFVLTTASWFGIAAVSALPFFFSDLDLNIAESYFEAMSGLTTTGGTTIVGLDGAPAGILLWRSLLQWLGGVGIIVMGIAILPFLKIGGMQLFHSESSDRSDKVVPSISGLALNIGILYLALTAACFALLRFWGMGAFDAINHAMTSVSTAGFSTKDASIGYWSDPGIQWTITLFMLAGALPFVRYVSFMRGDYRSLWRDAQVRHFLIFVLLVWGGMALWLEAQGQYPLWEALRHAAFSTTSMITTTGFATEDYALWGSACYLVFYTLMFVGGCTGSTTGGIKFLRFDIMWLALKNQLVRLYSPHQVRRWEYNDRAVSNDVVLSVVTFFFVFVGFYLVFSVILGMLGLDFITAITGAATALANVGLGMGDFIGPAGNFASLPDSAKWVLAFAMLMGRLEFFTVLVLLTPGFWKK
ncbi:TrkH family potassium uptake protein [Inquilinus sp. CAU 1745]|uniref:TrkH family potassium uptake protein n=1 Tax=Inquilinus sp. CAU 1745 TaxID=3140369 RepID=UPI00325B2014